MIGQKLFIVTSSHFSDLRKEIFTKLISSSLLITKLFCGFQCVMKHFDKYLALGPLFARVCCACVCVLIYVHEWHILAQRSFIISPIIQIMKAPALRKKYTYTFIIIIFTSHFMENTVRILMTSPKIYFATT